ncbi:MAG: SPOR domain-containing protein [Methyloprofundus sp.]|nr:SPOR domain-containing protein [Methyloprofundus sp.]
MNESLKHRIVGAIVITALAAIFIPMLFDDPIMDADNQSNNELLIPGQASNQMAELIADIPQSHEAVISTDKLAQINLQQEKSIAPSTDEHLKSYVIQVGSFNSKTNANEFKDRLRQQKFTAYVTPIKSKNGTSYRLFVGPELGHDIALKTQQRLEKTFNAKTLLISK